MNELSIMELTNLTTRKNMSLHDIMIIYKN